MAGKKKEKVEVSEESPFAGCAILIVAVIVMIFLIGFSILTLFRQFNEIAKFTQEKPARIEIVSLENREPELNRLAEKLEKFRLAVEDDSTTSLELNAEEINLAIAAYEPFKDLRGMLHVEEISPENVRLSISFQLNGKPRLAKKGEVGWMGSDPRYLSGTLVAEPGLMSREVILQIRDIIVPGKKVPVEFIERMSPYRIAERYVGSEGIGTTMAKLTKVEIGEGVIRFHKTAGEEPEDAVTNAEVDSASRRFFSVLAIAACIFPLIVGIILFVGMRLKKSKERTV